MGIKAKSKLTRPEGFLKVFQKYILSKKFKASKYGSPISFKKINNKRDRSWTKWMEGLMQKIAVNNDLICFNYSAKLDQTETKEIMNIDHVFTENLEGDSWYLNGFPIIAIEHENCSFKPDECLKWSFWKLLHFNAQLNVLIGYPYEKHIDVLLTFFADMIKNRRKNIRANNNFLVIFGLEEKKDEWKYCGYKFENNNFILISLKTS